MNGRGNMRYHPPPPLVYKTYFFYMACSLWLSALFHILEFDFNVCNQSRILHNCLIELHNIIKKAKSSPSLNMILKGRLHAKNEKIIHEIYLS